MSCCYESAMCVLAFIRKGYNLSWDSGWWRWINGAAALGRGFVAVLDLDSLAGCDGWLHLRGVGHGVQDV
jgi:hypothetical protein